MTGEGGTMFTSRERRLIRMLLDTYDQFSTTEYSRALHRQIREHLAENRLTDWELRGMYTYAEHMASLSVEALLEETGAAERKSWMACNAALAGLMLKLETLMDSGAGAAQGKED